MSLSLAFIISRQTPYYFWKVLLPLYLVTALSFTAFHYETDDLTERSALTSSYFLASFAMLYVVGDSLLAEAAGFARSSLRLSTPAVRPWADESHPIRHFPSATASVRGESSLQLGV